MGNKLTVSETAIVGIQLIESIRNEDPRGSFSRWFCQHELAPYLMGQNIVQVNHSFSHKKGTLRGLHFQHPPFSDYKLVRCISGRVFDIAVDLRHASDTFLQYVSVELDSAKNNMLVIPPGCAHGFQTLTDDVQLLYMHTAFYHPESEGGIRFDEPQLNISWPLAVTTTSDRDLQFPFLSSDFNGVHV